MSTNYDTSIYYQSWELDPLAQTFLIDKINYPNGVFLKSIKIFFSSKPKDSNVPVTLSIVGTLNGYPNGTTLDYSIVTKNANEIKVSSQPHYLDPNTYTEFEFKSPVYIKSGIMYAFILQTKSSDYNVFIAAQNSIAIPSTVKNKPTDLNPSIITKINTVPYVGSLFESQNAITWTADQGKSVMFVMERCVFDTSKKPKLPFIVPSGLPGKKIFDSDIERFYDSNNTTSLITTKNNKESHAYNMTTTDFVPSNCSIKYTYKSIIKNSQDYSVEKSVSPGSFACPTSDDIFLNDNKGPRELVANSNYSFLLYSQLSSNDNTVSPIISDDGLTMYNIQWNINNLEITNTTFNLVNGGSGYNASNTVVEISAPFSANGTQAYANVSIKDGVITSINIIDPGSGYTTTPSITITDDLTRSGNTDAVVIINGETSPNGGNALCRYITKKVILSEGNDSGDLRVYYTAYRPLGSNIFVYYKIMNRFDTGLFEDNDWQLMTTISNSSTYSKTRNDLFEFVAAPGLGGIPYESVSYNSTSGELYTSFNQFAIKIVLTTNDKTSVPFLTDIRAIALPSGTGMI